MGHHDGKADAEQQGKQAVKLAVNKHVLEEADHPVDSGGGHGGNNLRTLERVQGKLRKFARQMPKSASPLKASRITERSRVLTGPILSTGGIRPSFPITGHRSARIQ